MTRDSLRGGGPYRSLFMGAKVVMLLIAPEDGGIVEANPAAAAFYGLDLSRVSGLRLADLDTRPARMILEYLARVRTDGASLFHGRHRVADGGLRDVEAHFGLVEHRGRTLLLAIVHDVTERTRLDRERQRLAMAVEQSSASIVITLPDGSIDYVNQTFCTVTGYTRDEVIGQNPRLLKSGNTTEEEYRAIWSELTAGRPWSGVFHNRRKNGELYWEHARIFPMLDADGQITHYVGIKEDITQRKQDEQIIQGLTRRYRDVLSAASEVAIIATDPDGMITVFNSGAEKMLGYVADEMVGRRTPAAFHLPEEVAERAEELTRQEGRRVEGFGTFLVEPDRQGSEKREWTYRRKDGSLLTVSLVVTPVRDETGEVTGYLGVAVDVTERLAAQRRLQESEERFRTLVEGTTDWVWETDDQHRFVWFSPSFSVILGGSFDHLLGKRRWDMASDRYEIDPRVWQAHIEDLSSHRGFRDFRYWLRLADGEAKWISISGSPRFGEAGAFLGYRGSGTDITFEAAAALRLKMLSTVVDQSPVSVVITDTEGRMEYVNAHFTAVTGYSAEEAIGQPATLVASDETPPEVHEDMWQTISDGRQWRGEVKNRKKNGELHWEVVAISPIFNDEHKLAHYVGIREDITYRKETENRISEVNRELSLQAAKLQAVNAELEQFAYVASHDLRQPLRMVSSYLTLIGRRLGDRLTEDEELRSFFDFAVGGARRMDRLILDLLDYSRTGRRANPMEPVDLSAALGEALTNLKVALAEAEVTIDVPGPLPTVVGDPLELTRLFQNLIGNAVKYRSAGRAPIIRILCQAKSREWIVSIADNGIGIRAQDRDRAFMVFQRLVAQDAYEGTGIGLAVCRKIVENHGGRIWIEDGLDGGSSFLFSLPMSGISEA